MDTITHTYRKTSYSSDPGFFDWTSTNLPDPGSYWITDVDAVIRDRQGRVLLLEIKRQRANVKTHQAVTLAALDYALRQANGKTFTATVNGRTISQTIDYQGCYVLQFEKTGFEDGAVYLNGQEVTEAEVRRVLSFEDLV